MHLSRTIQRLRRRPAQGCIRRAAILRLATPVGQTLIASASAPNGNNAQGASANLDLIFALNPQDNRISGYSQSVNGASSVQALTYDASGAITAQGGLSLGYDARGLLASASNANGQSLYRHNSLAQRVQKSAQGQSTSTLYGPRQLGLQSQPLSQQQGANTLHHIYLPTPEGPLPVALIVNNSTKLAIHSDHLGTPRRITSSTGEVLWQWVIAGFGEVPPTTSSQAFLNDGSQPRVKIANGNGPNAAISYDLRYPGQQADAETGLFYNHHRSYDPFVGGRYTQADPIGLEGGWNRWGYVGGDPLGFSDPTGLLVELRCRPADIAAGLVNHCWMKTDTKEAGMNEQASCSRAGNDASGFPFVPVVVSDHSCDKPTIITPLPNVDEACVNKELEMGKALGRFAPPFNSCQTFTQDVIQKCSPSNLNTPYTGYPRATRRK